MQGQATPPPSDDNYNSHITVSPRRSKLTRFLSPRIVAPLVFVLLFGSIGAFLHFKGFAATTVGSIEAESLTGSGQVVADASSSGGKVLALTSTIPAAGTLTTTDAATSLTVRAKGTQCHGSPQVAIAVDGKQVLLANVSSSSWTTYTSTTALAAGNHNLSATFTNPLRKGNCTRGLSLDVVNAIGASTTTATDTTPPSISMTAPVSGATVAGTVNVTANASDNVGVKSVTFYVDNSLLSTVTASPYSASWVTTSATNGSHVLKATASDASGNSTSVNVTVTVSNQTSTTSSSPPDAAGYFATSPAGSWSSLPSDSQCSQSVKRSTWEPRPENTPENNTMPNAQAVHDSFAARPRGSSYNANWDKWLLPRVDGQFTGTTDEIIQWASCKWGIADNILRAQAVRESTWYEVLHYTDGQCYWNRGCGDAFASPTADTTTYCNGLAQFGHDYQKDTKSTYGAYPWATPLLGMCPKTFSIIGIMAWESPAWTAPAAPYPGNQNGTMPFSRDSTAFAMDYEASYIRGCYEGWINWLGPAGDIWGCVGSWYSGDWHSAEAQTYITNVQNEINNHTWLTTSFANGQGNQYQCDPNKGCPQ